MAPKPAVDGDAPQPAVLGAVAQSEPAKGVIRAVASTHETSNYCLSRRQLDACLVWSARRSDGDHHRGPSVGGRVSSSKAVTAAMQEWYPDKRIASQPNR